MSGLGGQPLSTNLTSLSGLTYASPAFVKMTAAGTFTLDTNTYLTSAVTSVGLSMPSAFNVTNSPVTSTGTLTVTGAGIASQYIRGDGTLANFPASTGGGASVSYYLNGSVSQGTIGGVAYKEMNGTPVIGAGTDFTINADGYIAQFITDVGDPNKLLIPAGNWNFEIYFSASSGGGSPKFYIELYKYDGTTFTLIASNSATPENITGGTSIDLYFTALAVPPTTLLVTDRLAVRFYVIHSGRTITMHTENSHLSQIITTFSTGLTALNGLTEQVQFLATGTSGTDFAINSTAATHTFNLPTASATNRGALSSADWTTFNNKIPLAGTINAAPITGRLRTTNNYSVWKEYDISGAATKTLITGLISNNGTPNVPSGESDLYLAQAVHKGIIDYGTVLDTQTSQSVLEAAATDYDGGNVWKSKIYADVSVQLGSGLVASKVVVDASNGLLGLANYSGSYTANSFVQKTYVDTSVQNVENQIAQISVGNNLFNYYNFI